MILLFGKITGIHGIRGEVEVSFKDDVYFSLLPSLKTGTTIYISDKKNPHKILDIKKKKLTFVFALEGIGSIEEAKMLLGYDIYIDTAEIESLSDDTFYEAELIGFDILFEDNSIGVVTDCYSTKANSILDIKLNDGNIVSVPFVSAYFGDISRDKKSMQIKSTDIFQSV